MIHAREPRVNCQEADSNDTPKLALLAIALHNRLKAPIGENQFINFSDKR